MPGPDEGYSCPAGVKIHADRIPDWIDRIDYPVRIDNYARSVI